MLGRLDEELSCANSRYFRVALYANRELSRFLRENFVLHWSSERAVPTVTIDFGDGQVVRTTLAGNSAHYVLDVYGRVLDALPGLYSPVAFRRELEALLPFARSAAELDDHELAKAAQKLHREHDQGSSSFWSEDASLAELPEIPSIVAAEELTITKAAAQMPLLAAAAPDSRLARGVKRTVHRLEEARLDRSSRALLERLAPSDWQPIPRPLAGSELDGLVHRFEASIAADTERNERRSRPRIHALFARFDTAPSFETLNELVYSEIFLTPRGDPWLGVGRAGTFSALPDDGIVD
jgi:hypothetical protein